MSRQLSLFPDTLAKVSKHPEDEKFSNLGIELNAVDEIFAATERFRTGHDFMQLLRFIARFPNYSAFNGFLLYAQNPSATYVATARNWARKFRRLPKHDARPLVILAPMAPILFLFDVSDTQGPPVPSSLLGPPEAWRQVLGKIYENTLHNCTIQGIAVHETILDKGSAETASRITPALRKKYVDFDLKKNTRYLIFLDDAQNLEERYSSLAFELGHIFCGHLGIDRHAWWPERRDLNIHGEQIEADSVAYLVCRRIGLTAGSEKRLCDYIEKNRQVPFFSLNAVLQAVTYVEKMGKHRWRRLPKRSRY